MFNNKVILVTGGTGSFGKKFVEIVSKKYKPKKLIVFSRDELKQFEMEKEFNKKFMRYFIGDIRDYQRLKTAMKDVDYVVHAAAMKHVPAAEYNPIECIKTNINGAENIIQASIECNVKKVIALSTDKAVNPINLYGAAKLASDKLFIAGNNISGKNGTIFSVVRYGNVISSRGSIIPFFKKLVADKKKYLPITDTRMTRFFLTLEAGVKLVLNSFKDMVGGEIFIPKIPSIKIIDLAKAIAPHLKHKIIGIRPGEKLHEILCPKDLTEYTYEFKNSYIIFSPILEYRNSNKLTKILSKGKKVKDNFEYTSGNNPHFLTKNKIIKLLN
tara:strand:- start:2629 stop:3612 length:984 start_codon:yes stop_codon:yes gene_type:complete